MLTNCFRFAPRDSVPGLIAKICEYLKEHPGWSEEELEEQIKQFISNVGVESFNGRTGIVTLDKNDVNNLKIASAYFAEADETIDELNLYALYKDGIRFVFTTWNSATSGYDQSFVLEYFDGSDDVVYYPISSTKSGDDDVISVNGKTGVIELNLQDILGNSGAQVKLCTATEFTATAIETWNAYYNDGYRVVGVVNSAATAVDYLYVLKQDINNHQPIMVLGGASTGSVLTVNNETGNVVLNVVDVSEGNSTNEFAKIFIDENDDYPPTSAADSNALGGKPPAYYATQEGLSTLNSEKANRAGWAANKYLGTDATGSMVTKDVPSYSLPTASATVKGGVKVGRGLKIDTNGVLSLDVSNASGVSF